MARLMKTGLGAVVLATSALLLGGLGGAQADTITDYNFTTCVQPSSGYCSSSISSYGTAVVDVNAAGTSATITFTLTTGTIADPADASAAFQMSGTVTGIAVAAGSSSTDWNTIVTNGTEYIDYGETSGNGQSLGSFSQGLSCNDSSGCGTVLVLTVTGSGLGVSSNGDGYFAALDTQSGDPNNGAVATGSPISATPLPGALVLFGSVLFGGLGVSQWRRKRNHRRITSVLA